MNKTQILSAVIPLLLTACSNQQAAQLGMRSSSVNVYAQKMSNNQLCETLYYQRATSQTKVSIGAEFNRRGLSKKWCDREFNKLYVQKLVDQLVSSQSQTTPPQAAPIQPAI
ncbi:hypothetical protein [Vibrio alfacsensis]|uniref:hypothetical protein n=1 Tax=Vibrio alfacsensis TaxID=1074311 RepID=UPI004067E144